MYSWCERAWVLTRQNNPTHSQYCLNCYLTPDHRKSGTVVVVGLHSMNVLTLLFISAGGTEGPPPFTQQTPGSIPQLQTYFLDYHSLNIWEQRIFDIHSMMMMMMSWRRGRFQRNLNWGKSWKTQTSLLPNFSLSLSPWAVHWHVTCSLVVMVTVKMLVDC